MDELLQALMAFKDSLVAIQTAHQQNADAANGDIPVQDTALANTIALQDQILAAAQMTHDQTVAAAQSLHDANVAHDQTVATTEAATVAEDQVAIDTVNNLIASVQGIGKGH